MAKHARTTSFVPAEVSPPGDFIREELEARGWSQADLAGILRRPLQTVNQIINGRKRMTPETAVELAAAFGTSPELWLNLETTYRLSQVKRVDPAIARRAVRHVARA
jgi:HTH-type transcriptional regulator / antitoxin HigA